MSGLLPRIIRHSLQTFYELHVHFQKLVIAHFENWEAVGKEHILHHALALMRICCFALTHKQMILQTYTYLQDAKAKGFLNIKLLGALTIQWQSIALKSMMAGLQIQAGTHPKPWDCPHCQSSGVHKGGAKKCPAKELKNKPAWRAAKEALKWLKTKPGAFKHLPAEELAHD